MSCLKANKLNIIKSVDDKDPISLNVFWEEEEGKRKVVYPKNEYKNLVLYTDSRNLVRCFERESLQSMKCHNIKYHPVTNELLPEFIFNDIENIDLEELHKNDTIEELAFNTFQYFSKISIFIDSEWFFQLNKEKLLRLNYELRDFWFQNFTEEQRTEISTKKVFDIDDIKLEMEDLESIQKYLLNQMKIILECKKQEYTYMINYIIIGALGLFIPEIRKLYPDFSFSFI